MAIAFAHRDSTKVVVSANQTSALICTGQLMRAGGYVVGYSLLDGDCDDEIRELRPLGLRIDQLYKVCTVG